MWALHAQLPKLNFDMKLSYPFLGVFRDSEDGPPMMVLPYMENGASQGYIRTLPDADITAAISKIVRILAAALISCRVTHLLVDMQCRNCLVISTCSLCAGIYIL